MDQVAALSVSGGGADARAYPARPLLAVSLAVFRGDRVLLARRARPPMEGRYSLPGGLVEPGETLEAAALRETREEVDVEARILGFNRHLEIVLRDPAGAVERHYVVASFAATWIAGEGRVGPEASTIVWARRGEVAALPTTDHLASVVESAWAIAEAAR